MEGGERAQERENKVEISEDGFTDRSYQEAVEGPGQAGPWVPMHVPSFGSMLSLRMPNAGAVSTLMKCQKFSLARKLSEKTQNLRFFIIIFLKKYVS